MSNDTVKIGDQEYASGHLPGTHWATDIGWQILDTLKPGAIPIDIRCWLVGQIAAALVMERERIDTSDIPEVDEEWFKKAKLKLPRDNG